MVKAGLASLLLLTLPVAARSGGRYALPAHAKIVVQPQHLLEHYSPIPCPPRTVLTPAQLRRMFRTYHLVEDVDHEGYMETACVTEGTILVDGKKFTFMAQPENNLFTDWPDGKDRRLGGKATYEARAN